MYVQTKPLCGWRAAAAAAPLSATSHQPLICQMTKLYIAVYTIYDVPACAHVSWWECLDVHVLVYTWSIGTRALGCVLDSFIGVSTYICTYLCTCILWTRGMGTMPVDFTFNVLCDSAVLPRCCTAMFSRIYILYDARRQCCSHQVLYSNVLEDLYILWCQKTVLFSPGVVQQCSLGFIYYVMPEDSAVLTRCCTAMFSRIYILCDARRQCCSHQVLYSNVPEDLYIIWCQKTVLFSPGVV